MKPVPFYAQPDETHCFQASIKMVLKYFLPDREFSFQELDRMSAKIEGLSTWPQQMLINLNKMGFAVLSVGMFDGRAFAKEGAEYLRKTYGGETADWQIANSDIEQEQRLYKELLDTPGISEEIRIPNFKEMQQLLFSGYLLNVTLNSQKLNRKPGYIGHSVVIFKIDDQAVILHDPGPPALKSRQVPLKDFVAAWADPNEAAKNFIALKLKELSL